MTDNKAVMQPVAWMTKDGRVASDATKQNSMASPSKEAFNIPLYLSCVIAQPEQTAPSSALKKLLFKIDGLAGSGMIPWQIEDAYADYAESIAQPKAKT